MARKYRQARRVRPSQHRSNSREEGKEPGRKVTEKVKAQEEERRYTGRWWEKVMNPWPLQVGDGVWGRQKGEEGENGRQAGRQAQVTACMWW